MKPQGRYFEALKKLILFSAFSHIFILIIFFIIKRDITVFNYFSILELNLFFPFIGHGLFSQIISFFIVLSIYLIFCFVPFRKK